MCGHKEELLGGTFQVLHLTLESNIETVRLLNVFSLVQQH